MELRPSEVLANLPDGSRRVLVSVSGFVIASAGLALALAAAAYLLMPLVFSPYAKLLPSISIFFIALRAFVMHRKGRVAKRKKDMR